ncbi:MAG: ABC transporter permease [Ilumatobacter sp.]|uniref:ABC transporter permease n=1 Tax=Ilumatobacter sp. TaxID=1967498 RepID=UPI003296C694
MTTTDRSEVDEGPTTDAGSNGSKRNSARPLVARRLRSIIQFSGVLRKELTSILRQPRLLLILVVGPFLVLALFAVGFDQQRTVLDTMFVGPADSVYEDSIEEFSDELDRYVRFAGYTTDLVAAERALAAGDTDLIVIFPADPAASVLAGEQAEIKILHDKIDPIQQTTVEVSAQVAVQELNARLLQEVVGEAQRLLVPYEQSLTDAVASIDDLRDAVAADDDEAVRTATSELLDTGNALSTIVNVSEEFATQMNGSGDDDYGELSTSTDEFERLVSDAVRDDDISDEDIDAIGAALDTVQASGATVTTLDPRIIVRPFSSATENLQRAPVSISDFFAPGTVALLLQHMVLTFAALSLVTDRSSGLFELFRVGSIGAGRVIAGKVVAFALIGGVSGALLFTALRYGLDVPLRGDVGWLALTSVLLLVSSIGLGLCISLISRTDTQAVQYALLALLAALFFGGFFLDLDAFRYPVKALSWTMPVTYGTRVFRDVMLRGDEPALIDLVGLGASAVVYVGLAWFFLSRRLRVE